MSDSTKTVEIAVDDLVELIAVAEAALGVGEWINGSVTPSPGWARVDGVAWRIREKYLMAEADLDDDELYIGEPPHWAVKATDDLAAKMEADILEGMLGDEEEYAGFARFFDKEPWTGHITYPIPFHRLRQEMRERVNALRERKEAGVAADG
jgi:hypothetical protein